ncbi:MAG: hypothetical protein P9L99_04940 [Candidatus Lernaella stagnicola]|nr:hypothetical protein [Candidatus Lernaella stagnicola]
MHRFRANVVWLWVAVLMLTMAAACFSSGDGDEDDEGQKGVDCNPDFCDDVTGPEDCQSLVDEDVREACSYCLRGSLRDEQIAQCILDNRDKATGAALRDQCITRVDQLCGLAEL